MTRYRMPEGVLQAELEGEQVLLNPVTGMYHLLNKSGKRLVDAFADGLDLDAASQHLATHSGVDQETVRADALLFVETMIERGLLEEVR